VTWPNGKHGCGVDRNDMSRRETGDVLLTRPGGLITYSLVGKQFVAAVSGPVSAFFGGGTGTAQLTLLALP
jgi:hypothetical protein